MIRLLWRMRTFCGGCSGERAWACASAVLLLLVTGTSQEAVEFVVSAANDVAAMARRTNKGALIFVLTEGLLSSNS